MSDGLSIMTQLVVPGLPLLLTEEGKEEDVAAVEDIRNRWCSYLGREMGRKSRPLLVPIGDTSGVCHAGHKPLSSVCPAHFDKSASNPVLQSTFFGK